MKSVLNAPADLTDLVTRAREQNYPAWSGSLTPEEYHSLSRLCRLEDFHYIANESGWHLPENDARSELEQLQHDLEMAEERVLELEGELRSAYMDIEQLQEG